MMDNDLYMRLGRYDMMRPTGTAPTSISAAPSYADSLATVSASARIPDFTGRVGLTVLVTGIGALVAFHMVTHRYQR